MKAFDVPNGRIFKDDEGDKFVRVVGGAVMFYKSEIIEIYTDDELVDFDNHGYFENCVVKNGTVKVKVKK